MLSFIDDMIGVRTTGVWRMSGVPTQRRLERLCGLGRGGRRGVHRKYEAAALSQRARWRVSCCRIGRRSHVEDGAFALRSARDGIDA